VLTAFALESAFAVSTGATWAGTTLGRDCWSFAGLGAELGEVLFAGEFWAQTGARGSKMSAAAAIQGARVDFRRSFVIMKGIPSSLSRKAHKKDNAAQAAHFERARPLLQTILPVISRKSAADCGIFPSLKWDAARCR
jgi:hypothetical protein